MKSEVQINQKFLVRLKKAQSQALKMLQQMYDDNTMSHIRAFEWHKRSKESHEEWKITPRVGRAFNKQDLGQRRASNTDGVSWDRRLMVRIIASQQDMKKDNVWKIVTKDLSVSKKKKKKKVIWLGVLSIQVVLSREKHHCTRITS